MSEPHPGPIEVSFPLARQLSDALLGAVYPLQPNELSLVARENEAPATLVTLLSGLPPRRFGSLREVQLSVVGPGAAV